RFSAGGKHGDARCAPENAIDDVRRLFDEMLATIEDDKSLAKAQIAEQSIFGIDKQQVDPNRGSDGADNLLSVSHRREIDEEDRAREVRQCSMSGCQGDCGLTDAAST